MFETLNTNLTNCLQFIQNNSLFVTLTSGGIVVWLFTNLKNIWFAITGFIRALISFDINNTYEDSRGTGYYITDRQDIFNKIITEATAIWERTCNLDLSNAALFANDTSGKNKLSQTYGFSIKILFGKLCFLYRSYKLDGQKITITTSIRVYFAKRSSFMQKFENEINDRVIKQIKAASESNTVTVINGETYCGLKNKRKITSVFTNNNEHIELLNDIKKFLSNKELYQKLNYPYKYTAMLYGVPGAGKSSTLLALASELNREICYVNLAQESIFKFLSKLNYNTDKRIFVFEDVDALMTSVNDTRGKIKQDSDNERELVDDGQNNSNPALSKNDVLQSGDSIKLFSISLSDLLNITDGLLSTDGAICIFTTNHIEKLDPALLRAGRMNKLVEFKYLNHTTANRMIKEYLGYEIENLKDDIKPAELQEEILNIMLNKKDKNILIKKFTKSN